MPDRRGLVLMLATLLCLPLYAAADDHPETEPIQPHQTGYHAVKLPGVPFRVFYETRLRYGWEPWQSWTDRYRRTPDEPHKFRNYPK